MTQFEQEQEARLALLADCRRALQKMSAASPFGEPPEVIDGFARHLLRRLDSIELRVRRAGTSPSPARDLVEYNIFKGEFMAASAELQEIGEMLEKMQEAAPQP